MGMLHWPQLRGCTWDFHIDECATTYRNPVLLGDQKQIVQEIYFQVKLFIAVIFINASVGLHLKTFRFIIAWFFASIPPVQYNDQLFILSCRKIFVQLISTNPMFQLGYAS